MNINPKALNLDAIQDSKTRVTLGFKCSSEFKIKLAKEAEELGLTLSKYTEELLINTYNYINLRAREDINELLKIIEEQSSLIDFYESPQLNNIYNALENMVIPYQDTKGNKINLSIKSKKDVYTLMLNSFKLSNK